MTERVQQERCGVCGGGVGSPGPIRDYNPETEAPPPVCRDPFHESPQARIASLEAELEETERKRKVAAAVARRAEFELARLRELLTAIDPKEDDQ